MRKKKVLFFLSNLNGGGAQKVLINIVNNLDDTQFNPKLILLNYNENQHFSNEIKKEIEIINLKSRARNSIFKIKRIIKKEKPEVMLSTLSYVNTVVTIAHKLSKSNAKLILRETSYRGRENTNQIESMLYKYVYNYCDLIIAQSKSMKDEMLKSYKISQNKIKVINNPVNIEWNLKKASEIIEQKLYDGFKIVSCGRLTKQKNYQLLIESLSRLPTKNWHLYIIGEGEEKENIEKLIIEHNLISSVTLLGFQQNPYKYMKAADLFVLSSLWEGLPNVILESMSVGTPVLSTDCDHGPREILEYGKFGWLVENNNAKELSDSIKFLVENKQEILKMKQKIKDKIKQYHLEKIINEYEKNLK